MSRNAQSLSRLRAAFFCCILLVSGLAEAVQSDIQEIFTDCEAWQQHYDLEPGDTWECRYEGVILGDHMVSAYWHKATGTSFNPKSWSTLDRGCTGDGYTFNEDVLECVPPDYEPPPDNNCQTDTVSGAGIMAGNDTVGGNAGVYNVDGCAYSCGANFDKMDGNTPYSDVLECTGLGESSDDYQDDPGEETPQDCITDDTGKTVCLDDEQMGCYEVNGKTECPSQNAVCGIQNGTFNCVEPMEEGCGEFNGQKICYDSNGDKVTDESPDHPDNGGNLDGDDTNDMTDPRPESEGGDSNKQPGDTTGQGEGATEGTAKEGVKQQKITNKKLDGIEGGLTDIESAVDSAVDASRGDGNAIENGITSALDGAGDAAVSDLDGHISGIDSPAPMTGDDLGVIEDTVTNLFAGSMQCNDLVFGTDKISYTITCADMSVIRDLLAWLLYAFTILRLFDVVMRPQAKGTP